MGYSTDRRHFLVSGLSVVGYGTPLAGLLFSACRTTKPTTGLSSLDPSLPVRKSATDPSNTQNIELYKKAVAAMKASPFPLRVERQNVTWWEAHALIHDSFCPHSNWFFLPWHRAYLYYFEKVCRAFCDDPSFALPYWDWSANGRIPDAFATGTEQSNPLFNRTRRIRAGQDLGVPEIKRSNVDKILDISDFYTFGSGASDRTRAIDSSIPDEIEGYSGRIEAGPHNRVHATINGDMGTFTSPRDPIFWLHHCNIDRLWAEWVIRRLEKQQEILPIDPKAGSPEARLTREYWLKASIGGYYDISKEGSKFIAKPIAVTVSETIDPVNLNIIYDSVPQTSRPDSVSKSMSLPPADVVQEALSISTKVSSLPKDAAAALEISIASSPDIDRIVARAISVERGKEATLRLLVSNIPFPAVAEAELQFFLNASSDNLSVDSPQYIGSMSFFGHNHSHKGLSAVFDLVPTLENLAATDSAVGTGQALRITVQWKANPTAEDLKGLKLSLSYLEQG